MAYSLGNGNELFIVCQNCFAFKKQTTWDINQHYLKNIYPCSSKSSLNLEYDCCIFMFYFFDKEILKKYIDIKQFNESIHAHAKCQFNIHSSGMVCRTHFMGIWYIKKVQYLHLLKALDILQTYLIFILTLSCKFLHKIILTLKQEQISWKCL